MWPAVKKLFSPPQFEEFVHKLAYPKTPASFGWQPKPEFIVVHNTAEPSLAQWAKLGGLQRIKNLESYYKNDQKWSGGPHLFVAPEGIWLFNALEYPGVHSPSWNRVAFGVEMVGDYDTEDFNAQSGASATVRAYSVQALAVLSAKFSFDSTSLRLHKEDPKTTHECPGKTVHKGDLVQAVHDAKVQVLARWGSK